MPPAEGRAGERRGKRMDNGPVRGRPRTRVCSHTRTHTQTYAHGCACGYLDAFGLYESFNLSETCFNCCDRTLLCPDTCSHDARQESRTQGDR